MGQSGTAQLLILSQVILSMQLSFAVIPLVMFTSDKLKMGEFVNEILSKVVYSERVHPVEMISKVSLGSLLDLFLTVDEFDARYDFGEQFLAVEPAPVFLGFQAQFKDHCQCRDS